MKTQDIVRLHKPSDRDYQSVRNWFSREQPIVENEQDFVERREDIVTLRQGRECAIFRAAIENILQKLPRQLTKVCHTMDV